MAKQFKQAGATSDQKSLADLQKQFNDLCAVGMRGAAAISSFRESPKEKLETVKECTAQIRKGVSSLRTNLEATMVPLLSGEKVFSWEYQALIDIAANAGLSMEEIESKIKVQNGSIVQLNLIRTGIKTLSSLTTLSSLEDLMLDHTQVQDLSALAGLPSLLALSLGGTRVQDLTPLRDVSSLQELYLDDTRVIDLTALSQLSSLSELVLSRTLVRDISPLSGLQSLRDLDISGTSLLDISPLTGLSSLEGLWLKGSLALASSKDIIAALEDQGVFIIR